MPDYYLEVDGIPGDAAVDGYWGQIVVLEWAWAAAEADPAPARTGPHPARMESMRVTKGLDRATPKLMLAYVSGQPIARAVLCCVPREGSGGAFLRLTLTEAMISAYSVEGTGGEKSVREALELSFRRIEIETTQADPDGMPAGVVRTGWNFELKEPC